MSYKAARSGAFDAKGREFREGDKVRGLYGEGVVRYIRSELDYRVICNGILYFLDSSWVIMEENNE